MELEMERETFCKFMYHYVKDMDTLLDILDCGLYETDNFIFTQWEQDCSIIYQKLDEEPKVINWYKQNHLGRCLHLWGFEDIHDFIRTLALLNEDINELRREKGWRN